MRKIYDEYFQVPEEGQGNVREKVFFARLIVSVAFMALCMFAMGYNAYAYFTSNVESTANVLQASTYSFVEPAEVEETEETGEVKEQIIKIISSGSVVATETKWKYELQAGTYDFKLIKEGSATTGYGRIDILSEDGANSLVIQSFYTQQIGKVKVNETETAEINERTVRIQVDVPTVIQVVACWGTYSNSEENPAFDENSKMVEVKKVDDNLSAALTDKRDPVATEPSNGSNASTQNDVPKDDSQTPADTGAVNEDSSSGEQSDKTEDPAKKEEDESIGSETPDNTDDAGSADNTDDSGEDDGGSENPSELSETE